MRIPKAGSADAEPLPANPKRATVAAVNTKLCIDLFFIFLSVKIRRKYFCYYEVFTPRALHADQDPFGIVRARGSMGTQIKAITSGKNFPPTPQLSWFKYQRPGEEVL